VEPLIAYVRNPDGDIIARQYCAMCLGNVAADPDFHEAIVKVSCWNPLSKIEVFCTCVGSGHRLGIIITSIVVAVIMMTGLRT
jgi:hypothetical protein